MKIKVKQIHVMQKVFAENGTYTYQKTIILINKNMTTKEYKQRQKQAANDFNVPQNMVGGIYENLK